MEGDYYRVMVASWPKVGFWPDGSTSPGYYRWPFAYHQLPISDPHSWC
jgi:hypothetical protein